MYTRWNKRREKKIMRISERENTHEGEIVATDMEEYKQILIHSCISHDSVEGSPKCLKG